MPRLSLERRLERQASECDDNRRYIDMSASVRRLYLQGPELAPGTILTDCRGGEWVAAEPATDGRQPVAGRRVGYSRQFCHGERLQLGAEAFALGVEEVLRVGGVWDTLRCDFRLLADGSRDRGAGALIIDAQESQLDAVAWLGGRIAAFRERRTHPQVAGLLYDDRRGGKSFVATLAPILGALEVPLIDGSPVEGRIVTQTVAARDEIDEVFDFLDLAGLGWATFSELPKRMWRFRTGAKIRFLTTTKEESTLEGRMDIVVLNEAAIFKRLTYEQIARATQDRRGFVVLATNRPKKPRGNWVSLMWQGAERDEAEGITPAVARLRVDPRKNAATDQEAKGPIARSILYARGGEDEDMSEGEVCEAGLKLFAPPWSELEHVRPVPNLGLVDVTEQFTRTAYGKAFPYLFGQDYQYQCAGSVWRLLAPGGEIENVQMWCVWARWLSEDGDEDDLLDEAEKSGYHSGNCLVIPDCSGGSQGGKHKHGVEPPSFQRLRARSYHLQEPVEKRNAASLHARNPPVAISTMRARTWIAENRVYVVKSEEAAKMARALSRCDAYTDKYGDKRAKGPWAHLIDTFRYPQWWVQRWQVELLRAEQPRARNLSVKLRR